jgi:hypothetical protein
VAVPWGLDVLTGTVVESHGEGRARRVVVSVDLPDTGEDPETELVTYRAEDLEAAARIANERQPGAWLSAYRYEEELGRTLERLTHKIYASLALHWARQTAQLDSGVDFSLDTDDRRLIIEAKSFTSNQPVSRATVEQLLFHLMASHASAALLVTNNRLSSAANERLREAISDGLSIRAVQWDPSEDNTELDQAIRDLLAVA